MPVFISGVVLIDGRPAPQGTLLQACIGGKSRSNYTIGVGPEDWTTTSLWFDKAGIRLNLAGEGDPGGFQLACPREGLHADEIGKMIGFAVNQKWATEKIPIIGATPDGPQIENITINIEGSPAPDPDDTHEELAEVLAQIDVLTDNAIILEAQQATGGSPIPKVRFPIVGKRGIGSLGYLDEWLTPYAGQLDELLKGMPVVTDEGNLTDEGKLRWLFEQTVANVIYVPDAQAQGIADWWQLPSETLRRMIGDCEDTTFLLQSLAEAERLGSWGILGYVEITQDVDGVAEVVGRYGHAWDEYQGRPVETTMSEWPEDGWMEYADWEELDLKYVPLLRFNSAGHEEIAPPPEATEMHVANAWWLR
jgi:hypothetical protein